MPNVRSDVPRLFVSDGGAFVILDAEIRLVVPVYSGEKAKHVAHLVAAHPSCSRRVAGTAFLRQWWDRRMRAVVPRAPQTLLRFRNPCAVSNSQKAVTSAGESAYSSPFARREKRHAWDGGRWGELAGAAVARRLLERIEQARSPVALNRRYSAAGR